MLEAGGFRGSPPKFGPLCQHVSSWARGSCFPALGCLAGGPPFPLMPRLCSHLLRQGLHLEPVLTRLADWQSCCACITQGWG